MHTACHPHSLLSCKQGGVAGNTDMTAEDYCTLWLEADRTADAHSHDLMLRRQSSMLIDTTATHSMLLDTIQ